MKRLVIVGLLALFPALATAQTPVADDETTMMDVLTQGGLVPAAAAEVSYRTSGISFTEPLAYAFGMILYDSHDLATTALQLLRDELATTIAEDMANDAQDVEILDASPPILGDDRFAFVLNGESDGIPFTYGFVVVKVVSYLVVGIAGAVMGNMVAAVAPYVERMIDGAVGQWMSDDNSLMVLLPQLADMPPGFTNNTD